ncbi:MAG: class I SAM-dependent methyltransferase [Elusimicrobia bacterium]|nr:class I SAM-dependent methyltransferase [Elusimicrobiota bacterium]
MTVALGRAALSPWLSERGLLLDDVQWARLDAFLDDLRRAAATTNLTADLDEGAWWRRHIADGLAALPALRARLPERPRLLDLGAGAGFVGIALKVAWPEAWVTLQEASYRKYQFLNLAVARLGLRGLRVLWRRAGAAAAPERHDAVLERAVAALRDAAALALPLVGPGGLFVSWKSEAPSPDDPLLAATLARAPADIEEDATYRLPGEGRTRHLVIIRRRPL